LPDLKRCGATGGASLIDNVGTRLDLAGDPLLAREFLRTTGGTQVVLAGEAVLVGCDFRLFVAMKYPSSTSRGRPRG
jgi:hypothetical protein